MLYATRIDRNDCEAILAAVHSGNEADPYMKAILREIERLNRRLEAQTAFLGRVPETFVTPPFADALESVAFDLWRDCLHRSLSGDEDAALIVDVSEPPWPTDALSSALH
ncbi:MAG: hypothetical protein AB7R90_21985 [Reyranellaceae bacterium]